MQDVKIYNGYKPSDQANPSANGVQAADKQRKRAKFQYTKDEDRKKCKSTLGIWEAVPNAALITLLYSLNYSNLQKALG
ncbi:unnamed protein product [Ceratitis capitata]|uniref:(Mediterranean fruit fly) hypothetical protein n=1 Tax=Ceratitis capitata TaxID=7213 RepID=A0A811U5H6_CERCA|nr:unnamed protein product [Ceratitis capitata]